jgi:hypothetical protein
MKGWCFLKRQSGGILYITRMFGDFLPRPDISQGAPVEGYYTPQNFTIMQALYYLSYEAHRTPDLYEVPINGVPGQVALPMAIRRGAASQIIQPEQAGLQQSVQFFAGLGYDAPAGYQGVQVVDDYDQAECIQYHGGVDWKYLQFEPWLPENSLGAKNWIAKVLPDKMQVVLKLWDAWKYDQTDQTREASVYIHLKSLWGKVIPSLYAKTELEFFHALIFQYVKVVRLLLLANGRLLRSHDLI